MSSTQVELSDLEATTGEKFLAFVLAVFLLIGGLWVYFQPLDRTDDGGGYPAVVIRPADRAALDTYRQARSDVRQLARREAAARRNLELTRETYRTALDAGEPTGRLRL